MPATLEKEPANPSIDIDREFGNFKYKEDYAFDAGTGLSEQTIHYISNVKEEDEWLLNFRLRALKIFESKPPPVLRFPP